MVGQADLGVDDAAAPFDDELYIVGEVEVPVRYNADESIVLWVFVAGRGAQEVRELIPNRAPNVPLDLFRIEDVNAGAGSGGGAELHVRELIVEKL